MCRSIKTLRPPYTEEVCACQVWCQSNRGFIALPCVCDTPLFLANIAFVDQLHRLLFGDIVTALVFSCASTCIRPKTLK